MKTDITNSEDIALLVDEFYTVAFKDALLAPHFVDIDFPAHRPRMIAFWEFVLLDKAGYTTSVFDKHAHMKIGMEHFNRWVQIFHETVDRLFEGEKANDAKMRATTIGWTFGNKMEHMK